MESNGNKFRYTYSAKEQAELKKIREKYETRNITEESKAERVIRLDRSVGRTATAVSLMFGILGSLIMGFGMSLAMTDIGSYFGFDAYMAFTVGIVIGICGCIIAAIAYPIYKVISKHMRKKVAPEILRLTEELIK